MQKVFFLGKLSGANRKEAADIVRQQGVTVANKPGPDVTWIVVGDENLLEQDWNLWNDHLDAETRQAFEKGTLSILSETAFWQQFGGPVAEQMLYSPLFYTPSMLAQLTGLPLPILRRLQRDGVIRPHRQVHRLCYFGKESILPLKIMQNMLAAGLSVPAALQRLQKMSRYKPETWSDLRIEGKDLIFVSENGPVDHNGQHRLPFDEDPEKTELPIDALAVLDSIFSPEFASSDPSVLCEAACELESSGNLQGAADLYRSALAAGGGNPQINFQLAEILYRQGDLTAARERYYTAIELDGYFVEARANLGCVLAELGRDDLAAAAFRGALKLHAGYAEVRLHLARLLQRQGQEAEAEEQFQLFRELMPECKDWN